jgi:hypothetical protein
VSKKRRSTSRSGWSVLKVLFFRYIFVGVWIEGFSVVDIFLCGSRKENELVG